MDCTQWASIIFSQTSVTSAVILKNDNKLTLAKRLTLCTSLHSTNKEKNQFDVTQLLSDANSTYIYNEMDFFISREVKFDRILTNRNNLMVNE